MQYRLPRCRGTTQIFLDVDKNTKGLGGRSTLEKVIDQSPDLREAHGLGFETANTLRTNGGDQR